MEQKLYLQYSNAGKFNYLVENLRPLLTIDPLEFYTNFFNLATCNSDGLNNWGKILNVSRSIPALGSAYFGWGTEYPSPQPLPPSPIYPQNWGHGTWATTQQVKGGGGYVDLPDEVYRRLLFLTYQSYCTNYSIVAISDIVNKFVKAWDTAYSVSVKNDPVNVMQINYTFNFEVPLWMRNLFTLIPTLPCPCGVTPNFIYTMIGAN